MPDKERIELRRQLARARTRKTSGPDSCRIRSGKDGSPRKFNPEQVTRRSFSSHNDAKLDRISALRHEASDSKCVSRGVI